MKTIRLILLCISLITFSLEAKITETKSYVYFPTDGSELDQEAKDLLKELLNKAQNTADFEIRIVGHTDDRGSLNYNEVLSFNRTSAVKRFFTENGIDEKYLNSDHKGELSPALPNSNEENRSVNRRVEVCFVSYEFQNIGEMEDALAPHRKQQAVIDPQEEQLIVGKRGVKLLIPANSFFNMEGDTIKDEIIIELEEALDFSEFIAAGLQTKSQGQLLESGGMIRLTAKTMEGEELKLDPQQEIMVSIPNENRRSDMDVFVSNSGNDWINTERRITNKPKMILVSKYPVLRQDNRPLPRFRYDAGKPKEPRKPRVPTKPREPIAEKFYRPIPWYVWNKKKVREQQKNRYEEAMDRYDRRMAIYERREKSYLPKLDMYEKNYALYEGKRLRWIAGRDTARENFTSSQEYQNALRLKQLRNEKYREQFKEEVALWKEQQQKYIAKWGKKMDKMGITDQESLNSYVFNVNELDWINVDRFYKSDQNQDVILASNDLQNEKVLIIFKKIKSMIACVPVPEEGVFAVNGLPMREEKYIFAYKVEDKKPKLCFQAMDGSDEYDLEYRESSFVEIREILKQFGG